MYCYYVICVDWCSSCMCEMLMWMMLVVVVGDVIDVVGDDIDFARVYVNGMVTQGCMCL